MRVLERSPFVDLPGRLRPAQTNAKEQWYAFAEKLQGAIDEVDGLGKESERLTQDAVLGRVDNLHDVMIAAEKARTAMNLTLEVRGKVIEAYKEIMRMQF
ncbi:MAG: Flagellar hook-basal body complex protein FliE [Candidatus Ozemobacter sibiricus]|jgi:flagellar hook-basal body complex protein FliE|uniref:Flagellar hook-basal body complex protein FliE n=1 Tax=Candidatus Ozemobacter sibiricus TaxID=2268124 RepID=A0A367ZNN7_9BACT|nr:MAG: Flagellar hook-basal body complex protein FliE [Candidatus Ozemobacter sibiricus]